MASRFDGESADRREHRQFEHRGAFRRGDGAPDGGAWRKPRRERDDEERGDSRGGDSRGGGRRDFRGAGENRHGGEGRPGGAFGAPFERRSGEFRAERRPWTPPPYEIKFVPDQTALNLVAKKLFASHKAMPLRDIVGIFFANPDSTLARLEWDEEHKDARFHQCKACEWFSDDEEALKRHLVASHFADYFEAVEIEVDPPSGTFSAVAKCGITGKLIAPPNHHSFNRRVLEMLETPECAGISEAEYRARIERVTDPEAIEQWRKEASKAIVYIRKSDKKVAAPAEPPAAEPEAAPAEAPAAAPAEAPAAAPAEAPAEKPEAAPAETQDGEHQEEAKKYSREEAEELFLKEIAPGLMRHARSATASRAATNALGGALLSSIRREWDHEQRIPVSSLHFAIRGGLKARRLAVFRVPGSKREEFVSPRAPTPLNATNTVPELGEILDFVRANADCTREQLLKALVPEGAAPERASAIQKQLAFLLDRGHLVEFTSGKFFLPVQS